MAVKKKKRRQAPSPGGGRKPQGPFGDLKWSLTIRMPKEMKLRLTEAAEWSGRSLTQELLTRLDHSFAQGSAADPKALLERITELVEKEKQQ